MTFEWTHNSHSQLSPLPPKKCEIKPVMTQWVVLGVSFSSVRHLNDKASTKRDLKILQSSNRHLNWAVITLNMGCHVSFFLWGRVCITIQTLSLWGKTSPNIKVYIKDFILFWWKCQTGRRVLEAINNYDQLPFKVGNKYEIREREISHWKSLWPWCSRL